MNKKLKKILSFFLGILFLVFLALLPQILIRGTVGSFRLFGKIETDLTKKNKAPPPASSINPIEKEGFFHFLPGAKTYSLSIGGKAAAEPSGKIIEEATAAGVKVISLSVTDNAQISKEYLAALAESARQKKFYLALSYGGCSGAESLKELLPLFDALKIKLENCENSAASLAAAKAAGKHLEIFYFLADADLNSEKINNFLAVLKKNIGLEAIIHFSGAAGGTASSSTLIFEHAYGLAKQAGFKYIYTETSGGENTFCPDGSIGIKRQGDFLLENNLKNGSCPDGTAIPGVWQ
jgi:hypothetical protein